MEDIGQRAEDDARFARTQADICLRYEGDRPGRDELVNMGTGPDPQWLPRAEAVPYRHALEILVHCEADLGRIQQAARACVELAERNRQASPEIKARSRKAAELCEQAVNEFLDAGAAANERAHRKLLVWAQFRVDTWGVGALASRRQARSELRRLEQALAEIDASPARRWHTPWRR